MNQIIKITEGNKLARRIQQIMSQRETGLARVEAEFRERLQRASNEAAAEDTTTASDQPEEAATA